MTFLDVAITLEIYHGSKSDREEFLTVRGAIRRIGARSPGSFPSPS
jgi:hypothetical protein